MNTQTKILYPVIGSTNNWGQIINNNFRLLDDNIKSIAGEVRAIAGFSGFQLPYIQWYTDSTSNEYKFIAWDGNDTFTFYTKVIGTKNQETGCIEITGDADVCKSISEWANNSLIIANTAAYAIHDMTKGSNGCPITAKRGDLLVFTVEVGSSSSNQTSKQIKVYPATGIWMKPNSISAENQMQFIQSDYVEWSALSRIDEGKITINIPDRHFYCIKITNLKDISLDNWDESLKKYVLNITTHYTGYFSPENVTLFLSPDQKTCTIEVRNAPNSALSYKDWHIHFTIETNTNGAIAEQPINISYYMAEFTDEIKKWHCTFDINSIKNIVNAHNGLVCYISFLEGSE